MEHSASSRSGSSHGLERRDVLKAGSLLALGGPALTAASIRNFHAGMKYRPLGRTGMMVSEIGLGAHYHYGGGPAETGNYKSLDARREVVEAALGAGINFFDNCILDERRTLGQLLPANRDRLYLMTDVNALRGKSKATADDLKKEFLDNIAVLRSSRVDLFRFNNNNTPDAVTFELTELAFRVFEDLRKQGLADHFAVSGHDPDQMLKCVERYDFIEAFYLPYNYVTQAAAKTLFPAAAAKRVGVIVIKPFMMGTMFSLDENDPALAGLRARKDDLAVANLRFILSHPAVSTVIPGMRRASEVGLNRKALAAGDLSLDERRGLDHIASIRRHDPRPGYEWLTGKWCCEA